MKKTYLIVLELVFFALALVWFVPVAKSDPSAYGYFPESFLVVGALSISRSLAYRNGRSPTLCLLEVLIVFVIFVVHRFALNIVTGHGI